MTTYEMNKTKSLNTYEELYQQYQKLILSEHFELIKSEIIFDILKCRYLSDILKIYKTTDPTIIPKFNFKSGEEAKDIFFNIVQFKKCIAPLLNNIAFINDTLELKNKINQLVKNDDYLSDSLLLPSLGRIEEIIKDALKELPEYQQNTTKEFKTHFIESCIYSLDEDQLNILIQNRIIKVSDLDHIRLSYDAVYNKKVDYLCNILGHQPLNIISVQTKIRGCSFNNEDGSSRQEYLKELKKANELQPQTLQIVPFVYKPEIGKEEPAAYVMWGNKCLGFIDKTIIGEAVEKYNNISYSAQINNIRNKDDKYGCELTLTITSPKIIDRSEELEKG